ncbi:MAG: sensor histidine kinase [Gammaproteobacteria bacterium]
MKSSRTISARAARVFLTVNLIATLLAFGYLYYSTIPELEAKIAATIQTDLLELPEIHASEGAGAVKRVIDRRLTLEKDGNLIYLFTDASGVPIAGNLSARPQNIPSDGTLRRISLQRLRSAHATPLWVASVSLPGGYHLLAGRVVELQDSFVKNILVAMLAVLAVLALVTIAGTRIFGRYSARRLDAFGRTAAAVMRGDMSSRFGIAGAGDEFDHVAERLNAMLARVDEMMTAMRVVTDGIAHDFRSPLTRLKTRLELAVHDGECGAGTRGTLATAMAETDSLLRNLNALLEITRAEAGFGVEQMGEVDLGEMVRVLGDLYVPVAEERGIALAVETAGDATVRGHRELLAQALSNLIENAIKYSRERTQITLRAGSGLVGAYVVVADHGPGIPESERASAVRRFVRLEQGQAASGSGLGLSLVAAVAKLHGAIFSLRDNEPGLRAVIQFVVAPAA